MRTIRDWLGGLRIAPETALDEGGSSRGAGVAIGIGAGAAIGPAVWRTFIACDPRDETMVGLGAGLGLLALVCTGLGAWAAQRQARTGMAIVWTLIANVMPPTIVCLPTIIGLVFSVPAGIVAFAIVTPFVLLSRKLARPGTSSGWVEREMLIGASFALFSAASMTIFELVILMEGRSNAGPYDFLPVWLACLTAAGLALAAITRDVRRALVLSSVREGHDPGYRIAHENADAFELERHASPGAGPHRTAETRTSVGVIARPWARMIAATGLIAAAANVPVVFIGIFLGSV